MLCYFLPFLFSFIEDFFQQTGVTLTEEDKKSYERDLYMQNLPEKDAYMSHLKEAGFTDIEVCWVCWLFIHDSLIFRAIAPLCCAIRAWIIAGSGLVSLLGRIDTSYFKSIRYQYDNHRYLALFSIPILWRHNPRLFCDVITYTLKKTLDGW